jgi:ferrous iron transport protein A
MFQTVRNYFKHSTEEPICTPGEQCATCVMPLCAVKAGHSAKVVSIEQSQRFRKRLADLGIVVGCEVYVMRGGSGPMILAVRNDSRLALGRGMAKKIMVEYA